RHQPPPTSTLFPYTTLFRSVGLSGQDRLRQDLEHLLIDPAIQAELNKASKRLWESITEEWEPWLRDVYHATLGSALSRALIDLRSEEHTSELQSLAYLVCRL